VSKPESFNNLDGETINALVVHDISTPSGEPEKLSIVHQYDRNPLLMRSLVTKYVTWLDMSNPLMEWEEEPACLIYHKIDRVELFRGILYFSLIFTLYILNNYSQDIGSVQQ